ncbi:transposase [Desulfarculales bacterium]
MLKFTSSKGLATYLRALCQALLRRGLPRKLYLDNGPAFRFHHLEEITASLGIALVFSPPYVPQGKGKIEGLFRTVRSQLLPGLKGDTLRDINEALECWIRDVYHQRKHLGTGQAPCNVSPAKWSAPGMPPSTRKTISEKEPRAAWSWAAPSP